MDLGRRWRERVDTIGVVLVVLLCSTYAFPRWADWNQNSRFDLTLAIVDEGTLSIDCCVANTGDYAVFEGHTYSDKAPGLSFLAVPVYALWKGISAAGLGDAANRLARSDAVQGTLRTGGTGIRDDKMRFATAITIATFLTVALPAALVSAVLFHFLGAFTAERWPRLAVTLVYALATAAFPYSNAFYAHQLVAALLFTAFVLLFTFDRSVHPALCLAAVGFLLGLALVSEYPAALIVAVLLLYAAHQLRRTNTPTLAASGWIALGMFPPLVGAAAYHLAIFHTPWPVAYRYSALWQQRHSVGLISLSVPRLDALWGITFSPFRGLFFMSPVLLLSLWGWRDLWRVRERRAALIASLAAVGSFLLFNSASVMWWGGFAVGPRYLVPMLPFLAWPLIGFLTREPDAIWPRGLWAGLAVVSLVITWSITFAGQHFPEDTHRFPLLDYAWPQLAQGNVARNVGTLLGFPGWRSFIPLWLTLIALGSVWWGVTRR